MLSIKSFTATKKLGALLMSSRIDLYDSGSQDSRCTLVPTSQHNIRARNACRLPCSRCYEILEDQQLQSLQNPLRQLDDTSSTETVVLHPCYFSQPVPHFMVTCKLQVCLTQPSPSLPKTCSRIEAGCDHLYSEDALASRHLSPLAAETRAE